jgi:hypothetical protein
MAIRERQVMAVLARTFGGLRTGEFAHPRWGSPSTWRRVSSPGVGRRGRRCAGRSCSRCRR